ncbi:MAG: nucleotidyltransferase family protein [Oscillospiraceae bacterium]|nr:nucleotidyltransferase family protein [Oscillospiraceae bacterium]
MNTLQRGIITLLKSAVTEQSLPLPEGFDLQEAYPVLKRHHMSTLVYDGAIRCGIDRSLPVMQKLFQSYVQLMLISERQMGEVERVYTAFDEAGVDYLPLKGCVMKGRYPKPELRVMGDADVLIRTEQYEQVIPVLEKLGFVFRYESNYELVWDSENLHLELHKQLIDTNSKDFYSYFEDGWKLAEPIKNHCCGMNAENEMLFLFTHFARHFRDGGMGCRHVVDLWVYLRSAPELDEAYVKQELHRFGLLKFYLHIRELMAVWFEDAMETAMSEFLTDVVFNSGSFGMYNQRLISQVLRDKRYSAFGINSRLLYLWQTAFPSADVLKDKYTVLKKAPWLLPAVWLVRPFYKLLFERDTLEEQERNLQALSENQVAARRAVLREIGLDYNF